ncbi:MAG: FKBP-type peptidyl-prolyl cis-trans isomerase [Verrucomicrobia bacterium]|nr:FKBP-type peptidyl-prolyl cis-trans isomerase [Verrucomicrobiota bacterium]
MKQLLIPGSLALGLILTAAAQSPAETKPATPAKPAAAEATTPPVAVDGSQPAATPAVPAAPGAPAAVPETPAAPPMDPKVLKNDSSYALGFRTGGNFAQQFGRFGVSPEDLDTEAFLKGFMAAFKGGKPEVEEAKLQAAMQALGDLLQKREKDLAAGNLEKGKKFLEENKKRQGVITTASGMQYEILAKGGDQKYVAPKEGEQDNKEFMVNYKGTLIDGTEFDSSPAGQPVPMTLQVVPGFKEALTTMPVGAKWKLFLPSELAYGEERRSAEIGPNCVLIFELELVKIQEGAPQQDMPFPMPVPQGQ